MKIKDISIISCGKIATLTLQQKVSLFKQQRTVKQTGEQRCSQHDHQAGSHASMAQQQQRLSALGIHQRRRHKRACQIHRANKHRRCNGVADARRRKHKRAVENHGIDAAQLLQDGQRKHQRKHPAVAVTEQASPAFYRLSRGCLWAAGVRGWEMRNHVCV